MVTVPLRATALSLFALGIAACASSNSESPGRPDPQEHAPLNRAMVQMLNNAAIDNAILTQRTLFPYHFVAHAAALNDLGRRDLAVLGNHLRRHPGSINVHRADATEELYAARLETVRRQLVEFGVPIDQIAIADRVPDGDGDSSDRVVLIRARAVTPLTGS